MSKQLCFHDERPSQSNVVALRFAWIAVAILVCCCMRKPVNAAGGILPINRSTTTLPANKKNVAGFSIDVSWQDSAAAGYMPMQFNIKAAPVFPADTQLLIRLEPQRGGHSPPQNGVAVDIPIFVPQGTKQMTVTHTLPKWSVGSRYNIEVLEDGVIKKYYKTTIGKAVQSNWYSPPLEFLKEEGDIRFLIVEGSDGNRSGKILRNELISAHAKQAQLDKQLGVTRTTTNQPWNTWQNNSRQIVHRHLFNTAQSTTINAKSLPLDWRVYQTVDAVVLPTGALKTIKQNEPAVLQALRNWMMTGGCIVVTDCESMKHGAELLDVKAIAPELNENGVNQAFNSFVASERSERSRQLQLMKKHLRELTSVRNEVDRMVKRAAKSGKDADKDSSDSAESAQPSNASPNTATATAQDGTTTRGFVLGTQFTSTDDLQMQIDEGGVTVAVYDQQIAVAKGAIATLAMNESTKALQKQIQAQAVGAGRLISISKDCNLADYHWSIVARQIGFRRSATLRRGVDPVLGDTRSNFWKIAGVAQPPVKSFIGILALFVILVGPIAYLQTHRRGRSYLMFAIAPILAMVTTLMMFGYGVISDGFGSRARVRQVTFVDGVSGDASERVRSTYFSGIRPSAGLRFESKAEVVDYPDNFGRTWEELNESDFAVRGRVQLKPDEQRFDSAFIPSRTQTQFVSHQAREKFGRLTLQESKDGSPPTVSSSMDIELSQVLVTDKSGKHWFVPVIGAGAENVPCEVMDPGIVSKHLGDLYNEHRPSGIVPESDSRSRGYYQSSTRELLARINQSTSQSGCVIGAFEFELQNRLQIRGQLDPEMFLGLADVSKDVVAIEGAEITESVRYVYGTLP